jgi:hypothetical protein
MADGDGTGDGGDGGGVGSIGGNFGPGGSVAPGVWDRQQCGRSDRLVLRKPMMARWASFLSGEADNVLPFKQVAR